MKAPLLVFKPPDPYFSPAGVVGSHYSTNFPMLWGGGGTGCPCRHSQKYHVSMLQVPLQFPLQLRWCGLDMPHGMGCYVQSVVVKEKVYVGGGLTDRRNDDHIVIEYDISSGKWAKLPPYRAQGFAMTVINNQLVLVGGKEHEQDSKVLGVWRAEGKEWTHPYPHMSTARSWCSAVVYNEWLVVAGGYGNSYMILSSVEVMNTVTKQWYAALPTPTPWTETKTAIVGDTCYFMGGFANIGLAPTCSYCGVQCVPPSSHISATLTGLCKERQATSDMEGDTWTTDYILHSTLHQWVLACSRWEG